MPSLAFFRRHLGVANVSMSYKSSPMAPLKTTSHLHIMMFHDLPHMACVLSPSDQYVGLRPLEKHAMFLQVMFHEMWATLSP